MRFGYTIVYVADPGASLDFFERAFGLARRFLHRQFGLHQAGIPEQFDPVFAADGGRRHEIPQVAAVHDIAPVEPHHHIAAL